jgi:hypothetical protein
MPIDRARNAGDHIHQSGLVGNVQPETPKVLRKCGAAGRKWDLSQKPEGVKKRWVPRSALKACLRRLRGGCRYLGDPVTAAQFFDDLPPLARCGQHAKPQVAHFVPPRTQGAMRLRANLKLTYRLPEAGGRMVCMF